MNWFCQYALILHEVRGFSYQAIANSRIPENIRKTVDEINGWIKTKPHWAKSDLEYPMLKEKVGAINAYSQLFVSTNVSSIKNAEGNTLTEDHPPITS